LLLHAGCKLTSPPCSGDVAKGDTLQVEIIERWDESSRFAFDDAVYPDVPDSEHPVRCGRNDVKPGQRFSFELKEEDIGICTHLLCPSDFPTESAPYNDGSSSGLDYLCSRIGGKVRLSSTCEASRAVGLRVNISSDTFGDPQEGETPPVILSLRYFSAKDSANLSCDDPESVFTPDAENESNVFECADYWVVSVRNADAPK
jgi:hypothetical protein